MDSGADALIKAVVADFETAEGRSTARDGLKEKLTGVKPAQIKAKCIETLRQAGAVVDAKAPGDAAAIGNPAGRPNGARWRLSELVECESKYPWSGFPPGPSPLVSQRERTIGSARGKADMVL
jgi:hypothetical protein